jgi:hypothetical protein
VTPVHALFRPLLARDAAGARWLPALLAATPYGPERLGELTHAPGWLQSQLALRTQTGSMGAFEYPAAAPKRLLRWYIDHPDHLTWPPGAEPAPSPQTERLRRALVDDAPPGARARAQDRARAMLDRSSSLSEDWWRFEEPTILDCVLITERLVVTIVAANSDGLAPATPWYPHRSRLVHGLEAARHLAAEEKRYATLVLSERLLTDAADAHLERTLTAATPHLDDEEREQLRSAYLGNLTWAAAGAATGVAVDSLAADSPRR